MHVHEKYVRSPILTSRKLFEEKNWIAGNDSVTEQMTGKYIAAKKFSNFYFPGNFDMVSGKKI